MAEPNKARLPPSKYAKGCGAAGAHCGGVNRKTFAGWVARSAFLREHTRMIEGIPYWSYADLDRFMHPSNTHPDERTQFFGPTTAAALGVAARHPHQAAAETATASH